MKKPLILIVEDDNDLRDALRDILEIANYDTLAVADGRIAIEALEKQEFAMVITDIQMPRMDGHTLLKHIKFRWPDIPVMLMTAFGSIQKAVDAMREGAVDYLTKPFEAEVLVNMVSQYVSQDVSIDSHEFVAEDKVSQQLAEVARRVAASDATVMICGESGSGKEVAARYIHRHSDRSENNFVAINCAAIPENMLEATLFGYEKGAFTGAYKACPGKFEQADNGTLLLDEISEMDLGLQAKLLRVLQEREVERLGGNKLIKLNVRILATSNRNMREEVAAGNFREDLFYRLNVFPIYVPPLRERPQDIIAISKKLIGKHVAAAGIQNNLIPRLSEEAIEKLRSHSWPGNIREFDNVIQRALILRNDQLISVDDIQFEQVSNSQGLKTNTQSTNISDTSNEVKSLSDDVQSHEHEKILKALTMESGNRQAVADRLGISQRTLRYKLARMRENGIEIPNRFGVVGS